MLLLLLLLVVDCGALNENSLVIDRPKVLSPLLGVASRPKALLLPAPGMVRRPNALSDVLLLLLLLLVAVVAVLPLLGVTPKKEPVPCSTVMPLSSYITLSLCTFSPDI